jgi:hypothetical protein
VSSWRSEFCVEAGHTYQLRNGDSGAGSCDELVGSRLTPKSGLTRLQQLTSNITTSKGETTMSDLENRNPQHTDPQKPEEQKPVTQPNVPVPPKQEVPSGQPKTPQPAQEKHDQEKKKSA